MDLIKKTGRLLPNVGVTAPQTKKKVHHLLHKSTNLAFANQDDEGAIYPQKRREIAEAQKHDLELNAMIDKYGYTTQLFENTKSLCKDNKW
jgi:hypothetical protein